MDPQQAHQLNGAALAYIGDAIYEVKVRQHVLNQGHTHPNTLHKKAVPYVEATGQAQIMQAWLKQGSLSEQEEAIYKRGRNYKSNTKAKNASINDYRQATGFEALIGWLYLSGQLDRLEDLLNQSIDYLDQKGGF